MRMESRTDGRANGGTTDGETERTDGQRQANIPAPSAGVNLILVFGLAHHGPLALIVCELRATVKLIDLIVTLTDDTLYIIGSLHKTWKFLCV